MLYVSPGVQCRTACQSFLSLFFFFFCWGHSMPKPSRASERASKQESLACSRGAGGGCRSLVHDVCEVHSSHFFASHLLVFIFCIMTSHSLVSYHHDISFSPVSSTTMSHSLVSFYQASFRPSHLRPCLIYSSFGFVIFVFSLVYFLLVCWV